MAIYELRWYEMGPGQMPGLHARMRDIVPPIFARNGVPAPLATWEAVAGPRLPSYLYLLRWHNHEARMATWARHYADPNRPPTRGSDGQELTVQINLCTLRPAEVWPRLSEPPTEEPIGGLHECVFYHAADGRLAAVQDQFESIVLRNARAAGGRLLGLFTPDIGLPRPGLVAFFAWPDASPSAWKPGLHTSPLVPRLSFLLQPSDYARPVANFGQFPG